MPSDFFIKFGGADDGSYPTMEGDSDDDQHVWWCEIRSTDLKLKAAEQKTGDEAGKSGERARPTFEAVSIKKRVDWATTQLFTKYCEAAESKVKMTDDGKAPGVIDQVTIHICRPAEPKIPYLVLRYYKVRVVSFGIEMSGPEPAENIKFEFEKVDFEYQPVDAHTGKVMGPTKKALAMENAQAAKAGAGGAGGAGKPAGAGGGGGSSSGTEDGGGAGNSGGGAAGAGADAAPTVSVGGASRSGGGSTAHVASATESAADVNYPGLWSGNGFGVLPD